MAPFYARLRKLELTSRPPKPKRHAHALRPNPPESVALRRGEVVCERAAKTLATAASDALLPHRLNVQAVPTTLPVLLSCRVFVVDGCRCRVSVGQRFCASSELKHCCFCVMGGWVSGSFT